jgi:hypothetical protein
MQTGDPITDSVINWLNNGGSLSAPGATLALGAIVSGVLIPLLKRVAIRLKWDVSGIKQTYVVYGASMAVVTAVGLYTHAFKTINEAIPMAVTVSAVAMGMHANKKAVETKVAQDKTNQELHG